MTRSRIALLVTTLFCATTAQALASPVLLMVAGGGGGAGPDIGGGSGQAGTAAQSGLIYGGAAGLNELGGGGGGFSTNGGGGGGGGGAGALGNGYAPAQYGGSGGLAYPFFGLAGVYGGGTGAYGGGGGGGSNGGGGGGGYNGGGGGGHQLGGGKGGGGGGSSFLAAAFSNIATAAGKNSGAGSISIEFNHFIQSFSYTGAPQSYDVSTTGVYDFTASGGQGGTYTGNSYVGGLGATVSGAITLTAGTVLDLEVGGMGGTNGNKFAQGGGGGGSWVYEVSAATPVPEPGSLGLLGTALIGLGVVVRRRRKGI